MSCFERSVKVHLFTYSQYSKEKNNYSILKKNVLCSLCVNELNTHCEGGSTFLRILFEKEMWIINYVALSYLYCFKQTLLLFYVSKVLVIYKY